MASGKRIEANGLGFEEGLRKIFGTPPPPPTKPVKKSSKKRKKR